MDTVRFVARAAAERRSRAAAAAAGTEDAAPRDNGRVPPTPPGAACSGSAPMHDPASLYADNGRVPPTPPGAAASGSAPVHDPASLYAELVESMPTTRGKTLSEGERTTRGINRRGTALTYGEIRFDPFARALGRIKTEFGGLRTDGGVFYDLGSGTGKAVFAAALIHRFERCVGIEVLESLHGAALELQQRWDESIEPRLRYAGARESNGSDVEAERRAAIEFICGDIADPRVCDWSDATLCFANSTCSPMALMRDLASAAERCAIGTWFVTFTKELPSAHYVTRSASRHKMSWGAATVFVQEKIT